MSLRKQQSRFAWMLGKLILKAYDLGYEITMGDVWAHDGHKENSKHYQRLAADLNLFRDGVYLTNSEDHRPLGEYWQELGGTWGGNWADGNHYQL